MRHFKSGLALAGLTALLLTACGGGGGSGSSSSGGANQAPVANAGTAQTVTSGATVTLNGSTSNDPDGSIASYAWAQTAGSAVTLSNVSAAQPTFVAPAVTATTTLTFSLVVTDNRGRSSPAATVNITVNPAVNQPPIANAGPTQSVPSGTSVLLDGSGSSDPDGTIGSFAWTQTSGTAVTLQNPTSAQPSFIAPAVTSATMLTFSLMVTDNSGASSNASVNITVNPLLNVAPTAVAGANQSVPSGQSVNLNGGLSTDSDGTIATYTWTQTAGPAVALTSISPAVRTFTAPTVATSTVLTFSLVVVDDDGASSAASTVDVTVNPVGTPDVTISGRIRHARPPFNTSAPFGLNYASAAFEPTRGVVVRALYSGTETVITTVVTDANGDYSLQVPGDTTVQIRAIAWLLRDAGQPPPHFDVRVQDGGSIGPPTYSYTDSAFNSASGTTRNVDIPLNINAAGQATGTRFSGPFAALDTVYEAIQRVLSVAPQASFPPLIVDWGAQSQGTFFSGASPQRIALLSDLTEDTDEFDAHVVAHEFGHYIEFNFSRADNIGGSHGVGDRLDARVAFGEGFGYAFAAMVLDDPNARDSFVNNGTLVSGGFNVEDNPPSPGDSSGCWCSESSVWSILYDIYDSASDGEDTLSLGFQPIWDVLVGAQRTTPAFTTIFSFITALKAAQPASATAINTLVAAQNIDPVSMDAFGTGETHFPASVAQLAALPLYTTATIGGAPVVLLNVDDAGNYNKLGNHRYVRFNVPSQRSVTITLATSNATDNDPDFKLWRAGTFMGSAQDPPPGPESQSYNLTAGDYLLDIYDCANGCTTEQGTPGDYNLTLTIN